MKRNTFFTATFAICMAFFAQNQIQAFPRLFPERPAGVSLADYLDKSLVEPILEKCDIPLPSLSPLSLKKFIDNHPYFAIAGIYGFYRVYSYFAYSLPEQKAELQTAVLNTHTPIAIAKAKELARNLGGNKLEKIVENAILSNNRPSALPAINKIYFSRSLLKCPCL